jgi:hypothetical protein
MIKLMNGNWVFIGMMISFIIGWVYGKTEPLYYALIVVIIILVIGIFIQIKEKKEDEEK